MKSTKDAVYEFIRQSVYVNSTYAQGVQTKDIATALGKQRSNISSILNELVAEGKLVKSVTRPAKLAFDGLTMYFIFFTPKGKTFTLVDSKVKLFPASTLTVHFATEELSGS